MQDSFLFVGYANVMKSILIAILLTGCRSGPSEEDVNNRREKGDDRVAYSRECKTDLSCEHADAVAECKEEYLPTNDQRHIEGELSYLVYPPPGGPHNACWWEWGVSADEVPEERWIHNMEHGGVVFLYNCPEGCDEEVNQIITEFGDRERVIISPYSHMEWRFAVVAWEYRTLMNCLDIDALKRFYEDRFAKGPEDVAAMPSSGCMENDETATDTDTGVDTGTSLGE